MVFKPFHFSLNTDLNAVNVLINLPLASVLTLANFICFNVLSTCLYKVAGSAGVTNSIGNIRKVDD